MANCGQTPSTLGIMVRKKLRILLVEDNEGDEFLLIELLDVSGLAIDRIDKVNRLGDALISIQQHPVDLILLDLSLPDSSGINTFKSMRGAAPNVPVIILSGMTDMKIALDAINLGAQDYLIKGDFDEKLLAKTILYSIERIRNLNELQESNTRYNLISMATNDMVWDWDLVTGKIFRNEEGWKKIFRSTDEVFLSDGESDWNDRVHPDDAKKVQHARKEIYRSLLNDTFEVECRIKRDDGTYAFISDRGNIVRDDFGKPVRVIGATQDITRRKEAEALLAKSELRFRSLVQNGSDLISIIDEKGICQYVSPAITIILGYDPEFMIGKNALDFVHPLDAHLVTNHFQFSEQDKFHGISSFRFKNYKGAWRWLETKVTDMRFVPEVKGYILNSRDVTERIIAEEEIKKLSVIARETSNGILILDTSLKIQWVNESFERLTGYSREEAVNQRPDQLLRGPETNEATARYIDSRMEKTLPFACDIINYKKSGEKFWVRLQSQPQFDDAGQLKSFFAMQTDITSEKEAEQILKESEERYRYLFNNNPASIFIWDIETLQILEVNQTALLEYGYSREEFLSKTILDHGVPKHNDQVLTFIEAVRTAKPFERVNISKHLKKSGEQMYMNISSHRIDYNGRKVILGLATNITDKLLLEKELEKQKLDKQKEITDAVISAQEKERHDIGIELHDNINQILASSRLYLGLVKTESPDAHPYISETDNLIKSAINEIRNLSHSLIPPSLHESELIEALSQIVMVTKKTSGISISLKAAGVNESFIPDKLKLTIYRIVQEQFNNILKYANPNKVIVSLEQVGRGLILTVEDDGVGFDPSKKARGVGLTNIKTRSSLFNGEVTINSSPGNGCVLRVEFK